jgi:hypothetical protein
MDSTYITFLLLPFLVRIATQKSCSYAEKKGIRESHAPSERSGAAVIRTCLGIEMTPADADALAGVISPEPVTAVSRKAGKANSIAFHCDNRNFCEGQPESLPLAEMISGTDLFVGHRIPAAPGTNLYSKEGHRIFMGAPPLRTSGYKARRLVRAFEYGVLETDSERAARARRPFFAPMQLRLRLRIYSKIQENEKCRQQRSKRLIRRFAIL